MQNLIAYLSHGVPNNQLISDALEGEDRDIPVEVTPGVITRMKESQLQRRVGGHEDDDETALWVEYRLDGKVVHRSAHVSMKKSPPMFGSAASFA